MPVYFGNLVALFSKKKPDDLAAELRAALIALDPVPDEVTQKAISLGK